MRDLISGFRPRLSKGKREQHRDQENTVFHPIPSRAYHEPTLLGMDQNDPHGQLGDEIDGQDTDELSSSERKAADDLDESKKPGDRTTKGETYRGEEHPKVVDDA